MKTVSKYQAILTPGCPAQTPVLQLSCAEGQNILAVLRKPLPATRLGSGPRTSSLFTMSSSNEGYSL